MVLQDVYMKKSADEKQTTSATKKQSLPKKVRVIDERDQAWSSLNNLTAGMDPDERFRFLDNFVKEVKAMRKDQ